MKFSFDPPYKDNIKAPLEVIALEYLFILFAFISFDPIKLPSRLKEAI